MSSTALKTKLARQHFPFLIMLLLYFHTWTPGQVLGDKLYRLGKLRDHWMSFTVPKYRRYSSNNLKFIKELLT